MATKTRSEFVSSMEAAKMLTMTKQMVVRKIRDGIIPAQMIGHSYVIPRKALEELFQMCPSCGRLEYKGKK